MARKEHKTAKLASRQKGGSQAGMRVMHTVNGGPLTGYHILDPQGNRMLLGHISGTTLINGETVFENMWDAVNERKRRDAS